MWHMITDASRQQPSACDSLIGSYWRPLSHVEYRLNGREEKEFDLIKGENNKSSKSFHLHYYYK